MSLATDAFWLLTDPFDERPDGRFLIPTHPVRAALARLRSEIERHNGVVVLEGEPEVGKSVVAKLFAESVSGGARTILVSDPRGDWHDIREEIESRLELGEGDLAADVVELDANEGRRTIILIDSAEQMTYDAAAELEAEIGDPSEPGRSALRADVIFFARSDARTGAVEWATERDAPVVTLSPLSAEDTAAYVCRRVELAADGDRDLFDDAALADLHRVTGGIPGRINRLCAAALEKVAEQDRARVTAGDIRLAAERLGEALPDVEAALEGIDEVSDVPDSPESDDIGTSSELDRERIAEISRSLEEERPRPRASAPSPAPVVLEPPAPMIETGPQRTVTTWPVLVAAGLGALVGGGLVLVATLVILGDEPTPTQTSTPLPAVAAPPPPRVAQPQRVEIPSPPEPDTRVVETTARSLEPKQTPEPAAKQPEPEVEQAALPTADEPQTTSVVVAEAAEPPAPAPKPTPTRTETPPEPPAVSAPPPPKPPEPKRSGPPAPARVALPLAAGEPILDEALTRRAPDGVVWSAQLFDLRGGQPRLVDTLEVAHRTIDGSLRTVASLRGDGARPAARLYAVDRSGVDDQRVVYWPEDDIARPLDPQDEGDPFAGTRFRYEDFRPDRAASYRVTAIEGDVRKGTPIFVVTATPRQPRSHERVEFWIRERDNVLLEQHYFGTGGDEAVRRLVVEEAERMDSEIGPAPQRWVVLDADETPIAEARISSSRLADGVDTDVFSLSALRSPEWSLPVR